MMDDEQPMPLPALLVASVIICLMMIDVFAPKMVQLLFIGGLFGILMPLTFLTSMRK